MEVNCSYCGETFDTPQHRVERNDNNFCSRECYYDWKSSDWNPPNTKDKIELTCERCGDAFEVYPYRADSARFCSRECSDKGGVVTGEDNGRWNGGMTEFECKNCGDVFEDYVREDYDDREYCSESCYREAAKELFAGEDNPVWRGGWEHYYGANWDEQRLKAIRRDQARCQRCGTLASDMDRSPAVHHRKRIGWFREEYDAPEWWQRANKIENLVTLCDSCHSYVEWHDTDV